MTWLLAVDLAARFSAGSVHTDDPNRGDPMGVVDQFDSWGKPAFEFVDELFAFAFDYSVERIVLEDVPYGTKQNLKPIFRLQGIIMLAAHHNGVLDMIRFVEPSTWQRPMGVYGKGADGARAAASELGYTAPDMLRRHGVELEQLHGRERSRARQTLQKSMTDYDDAFLMGRWALGADLDAPHPGIQLAVL